MLDEVFDVDKCNVFSDDKYYYFFRALEELDIAGIKDKSITNQYGRIIKLVTDREFYGEEKYKRDSQITLEEMVEHIKMHYNKHTNCISFSTNANVGLSYGRSEYENSYIILRCEKDKMKKDVFYAPLYILSEITKKIEYLVNNEQISQDKIKLYKELEKIDNQEDLDIFIKDNVQLIDNLRNIDMFFGGIDFIDNLKFTRSKKYNALTDEQNFYKNKIVAMIDILGDENIIPSISNGFLIQTIGNAFASLEIVHYKDIDDKHLTQVSSEFMDCLSLVQQVPNIENLELLKQELIDNINGERIDLDKFKYDLYELSADDYSIEKMYELTKGDIDYKTAISTYKNMFYLAKSRLRAYKTLEWLKTITNNNPLYDKIYEYIEKNGYGIEEEIITRLSSNNKKLSESVGFNFNNQELVDIINSYSEIVLEDIINDPINALRLHIRTLSYVEDDNVDKTEYFARAIVDSYDWKRKLNIDNLYDEQKGEIIDKLKEIDLLKYYEELKKLNLKEEDIISVILTNVIKGKDIEDIDIKDKFTISDLEYFLDYSKIEAKDIIKLREYQIPIVNNINRLHDTHRFAAAITPTGSGKSFVALKTMLKYKDEEMLYIAPNNEILNQLIRYAKLYIHGKKNTTGKSNEEILKEVFPNLKLITYQKLLEDSSLDIIKKKYKYIVLDEIHRSGAERWIEKVKQLIDNQDENTKVLGISATPQRDVDYNDMSDFWAEYLGYTEEEILNKKHLACDIDLIEAIERGYITKPKIICCKYSYLKSCEEKLNLISNEEDRKKYKDEFEVLRRNIDKSSGIEKILRDNLKSDGKYIVFLPVGDYEDIDGNKLEKNATKAIKLYQNQMMQYVYAGVYLEKNIEKFNQVEKSINENIPFNAELIKWIEQEKDNLLLLSKMNVTKNSNLLVTESNYLVENIIERMGYERLNESKQAELLKQKTKSLMECYSMLGDYGDKKNNKELSNFNSSNSKKVKFMFVMNKLNEGVHPDRVDGIIWLRPLDKNSKILYLQQLGRCIRGLDDNEMLTEESQPVVLDLVNNTLNVDYEKGLSIEEIDLKILKEVINYLRDRNITNVNENQDEYVEKQLIRLNIKYKDYLNKDSYDEFDIKRKMAIKNILHEGSLIDLWNKDYDIAVEEKRNNKRNFTNNDILLDLFDIEQDIVDILELKDKISFLEEYTIEQLTDRYLEYLGSDGQTKEGIEKRKGYVNQKDRTPLGNTTMGSFEKILQKQCRNIKEKQEAGEVVSSLEEEQLKQYNRIQERKEQYRMEESIEQLIEQTDRYLEYLGSEGQTKDGIKRKGYVNTKDRTPLGNTTMGKFEPNLQQQCRKIIEKQEAGEVVSSLDEEQLKQYNRVQEIKEQYRINELIEQTDRYLEYLGSDGQTKEGIEKRKGYVNQKDRTPLGNTTMGSFEKILQKQCRNIKEKQEAGEVVSSLEEEQLKQYNRIQERKEQYRMEESIEQLIEQTDRYLEYLGSEGQTKDGIKRKGYVNTKDRTPLGNTTMGKFEPNLQQQCRKIIEKQEAGEVVSSLEEEQLKQYNRIQERKEQYRIDGLIEQTDRYLEYLGSDGQTKDGIEKRKGYVNQKDRTPLGNTTMGIFEKILQQQCRKIKEKQETGEVVSSLEEEQLKQYNRIQEVKYQLCGIEESKRYYDMYGDLNVITGYKCAGSKYPLREFLDRQRAIFIRKEKTESEQEIIDQLFDISPDWLGIKEDLDKRSTNSQNSDINNSEKGKCIN